MTTRQSYDQEIEALRSALTHLGELVEKAIENAFESLARQDRQLAQQVLDGDDVIDDLEAAIEDQCISLIARQQPLARDLRIISTGLKITTDLERMGDHACTIARITLRLKSELLPQSLNNLTRLAYLTRKMLQDALAAYADMDTRLAEQVCLDDDAVDELNVRIFREQLENMIGDPQCVSQATELIFVSRYLERIADHSTNIAEWLIYLVTGQRRRKK